MADSPQAPFPHTAGEITADWLTEILRRDRTLDESSWVTDVAVHDLSVGFGQTSDTSRVTVELGGTPPESAPRSVVAKFATTDDTRRAASVSADLYAKEVRFYRDVSPRLATEVPHCYLAEIDDQDEFFALLLDDLDGYRPGDETVGASLAEAHQAISQLATFQGPYWGRAAESGARPWTMLPLDRVVAAWPVMVETFGEHLPAPIVDMKDPFLASIPALHDWMSQEPCTLVHGDFRLDNLLFNTDPAADDQVVVVDWQAVHTGKGIRDFAYFVAHSVATDDRRAGEQELLRSYLDQLAAFGVDYRFDTAWHDYRVTQLYLFSIVLWITGVNVNSNERALRRKRALVARASAALLDVDALALLPFA